MSDPSVPEPSSAAPATSTAPGSQARFPRALGRYQLLGRLGRGGMGAVFRAHDTQLDRTVALKVPFLGGSEDEALRQRFFREARAAAALHHPNICPVFDVGEVELITSEEGVKLRVHTRVAEPGQHRRELFRLTGLEVQERQARRLLNDIYAYRVHLEQNSGQPVPRILASTNGFLRGNRANRVGNPGAGDQSGLFWFNPDAYAPPADVAP